MGFRRGAVAGGVTVALLAGVCLPAHAEDDPVRILAEDPVTVLGADILGCDEDLDTLPSTADRLLDGKLKISPFGQITMSKNGNLKWGIDPFDHPSWEARYRSLRWVQPLIDQAANRDLSHAERERYRDRAEAIIRDWLRDNPRTDRSPIPFTWDDPTTVALRSAFLLCARDVFGGAKWLRRAIADHARFLRANYSGAWNHGTMEALALYRIGCVTQDATSRKVARARIVGSFSANKFGAVLDAQGATNEQAVGYAEFVFQLWSEIIRNMKACHDSVPQVLRTRVAKLPAFITAATQPDGNLVQLGDTYARPAEIEPGTTIEYAATQGKSGPRPTKRFSVYSRGYVFGHSGWGEHRPFDQESFYSLRFGPAKQVHGHSDHMSLTYFAHGIPMLVDSGHDGYKDSAQRKFLRSDAAHNVLDVLGVPTRDVATKLTRKDLRSSWQSYTMTDRAFGFSRTRNVLFSQGPDIAVVHDSTGSAGRKRSFRQLWHLAANMEVFRKANGVAFAQPKSGADARLWMIPVPFGGRGSSTAVVRGKTSPRQGWVSEQALERRKAPVVSMTSKGTSARMLTVLVPASKSSTVKTSISRIGKGARLLTVTIDGTAYKFRVSASGTLSEV